MRWLDGIKALDGEFWRLFPRYPGVCSILVLWVISVAMRDALLWLFMGDAYLDE